MSWDQYLSLLGAFLLLLAYALQNFQQRAPLWFVIPSSNILGAALLTLTATINQQYGFIILEGSWTLISIVAFGKAWGRRKQARHGAGE